MLGEEKLRERALRALEKLYDEEPDIDKLRTGILKQIRNIQSRRRLPKLIRITPEDMALLKTNADAHDFYIPIYPIVRETYLGIELKVDPYIERTTVE
jgi:hypothetical protein